MYHQLCNQMLYKVLNNKIEGVEKFFLAKNKELLTEKKSGQKKRNVDDY